MITDENLTYVLKRFYGALMIYSRTYHRAISIRTLIYFTKQSLFKTKYLERKISPKFDQWLFDQI